MLYPEEGMMAVKSAVNPVMARLCTFTEKVIPPVGFKIVAMTAEGTKPKFPDGAAIA
jgi:hypothetical protein